MPQLTIVPEYQPTQNDRDRESAMVTHLEVFNAVKNPEHKREMWETYKRLHAQRTPEWVAWDEKRKGLNHG